MIHDIEVQVHHVTITTTKTPIHKVDIALPLEIALGMTKVLPLHNTLDQDITIIKEIRNHIALLIDPHTNHLMIHRYRSRSYSRGNNFTRDTSPFRPPSRPRESTYSSLHSNTRNKLNNTPPN